MDRVSKTINIAVIYLVWKLQRKSNRQVLIYLWGRVVDLKMFLAHLTVPHPCLFLFYWKEIEELILHISSASSESDFMFGLPDLSPALKQIQSQYDSIAAKNLEVSGIDEAEVCPDAGELVSRSLCISFCVVQEMETWYRTKFQDLDNTSSEHIQKVRSMREEIAAYRKNVSVTFCSSCGSFCNFSGYSVYICTIRS